MQVAQHMKTDVVACSPTDTLVDAAKKMAKRNIGSIVVVSEQKPIGILTERDIVNRVVAESKDPAKTLVQEAMTRDPVVVEDSERLGRSHGILMEKGFRHLPVTNDGRLVGIISQRDVSRIIGDQLDKMRMRMGESPDFSGDY